MLFGPEWASHSHLGVRSNVGVAHHALRIYQQRARSARANIDT
jgi:hypothetical protein